MFCDTIAFAISCILILIYYVYLGRRTRNSPLSSVHVFNAMMRERWVAMIMNSGKLEILAIQTLRNSLMAASFMATTTMLLIIGILNLSEKIGQWVQNLHPLTLYCQSPGEFWQIKLAVLLLGFAIAFYYFAMAIRFFNHVGYMINLPYDAEVDEDLYKQTCAYSVCRYFCGFLARIFWYLRPLG
jgi:uncharacterized membrane protein